MPVWGFEQCAGSCKCPARIFTWLAGTSLVRGGVGVPASPQIRASFWSFARGAFFSLGHRDSQDITLSFFSKKFCGYNSGKPSLAGRRSQKHTGLSFSKLIRLEGPRIKPADGGAAVSAGKSFMRIMAAIFFWIAVLAGAAQAEELLDQSPMLRIDPGMHTAPTVAHRRGCGLQPHGDGI